MVGGLITRESGICPRPDFSFVPGIFALGTNRDICTSWSYRLVQIFPHKDASGPPPTHSVQMPHICTGGGSAWYKCGVGTFVPGGDTPRYKCGRHLYPTTRYKPPSPRPWIFEVLPTQLSPILLCLSSSSSFSIVLISFFILLSSHISLDLLCRAPGGAGRPVDGAQAAGVAKAGGRRGCPGGADAEAGSIWRFCELALILWWFLCWFCEEHVIFVVILWICDCDSCDDSCKYMIVNRVVIFVRWI
jgi:hypothetical protein